METKRYRITEAAHAEVAERIENAPATSVDEPLPVAATRVHWPTGPVLCCLDHARQLAVIGRAMGAHVPMEPYNGGEPCINCVNEAKKRK